MNSNFAIMPKGTKLYSSGYPDEIHPHYYRGGNAALKGRYEYDEFGRRSEMVLRTYTLDKKILYIKRPLWGEEANELLNNPIAFQKKVVFLIHLADDKTAFYFTDKSLMTQIDSDNIADGSRETSRSASPLSNKTTVLGGIDSLLNSPPSPFL